MERVIFLDRDGTMNEEVHYLYRTEDLKLLPGVTEGIRLLKTQGYQIVVVTNQAGVARGYYTEHDVTILHNHMNQILETQKAGVDAFFYCPHHPDAGIPPYNQLCHCRKPEIGMFEQAETLYGAIDKSHSWMIGDKLLDIQAGINYGVHTALVGTGYGEQVHRAQTEKGDIPYDIYEKTLMDAAKSIIKWENSSS